MKLAISAIALALSMAVGAAAELPQIKPEGAPIDVIVLGTFHFDNPGQDLANSKIDDVLAPKQQAEIGQILSGLERFKPTKVAVESQRRKPGTNLSETYPIYRTGKSEPSRNEVVQVGFALAARMNHPNVYAVDVDGDFPFEAVMAFAQRTGRGDKLGAQLGAIQAWSAQLEKDLATMTLGQALRQHNDPRFVAQGNAFYLDTLRYGALDDQPGANLVSRWYERNMRICARIVQIAEPGDRVVVLYGSGHSYLLRHCLGGVPGYRIVEANDFLPN
jgi:hypothetical protein